jgi:hypothetical protein
MIRALGMVAILLQAAFGQAPAKAPEFEVADIKLSDGTRDAKVQFLPGGRVDFPNVTVKSLIMVSYGVQENMITGGPNGSIPTISISSPRLRPTRRETRFA